MPRRARDPAIIETMTRYGYDVSGLMPSTVPSASNSCDARHGDKRRMSLHLCSYHTGTMEWFRTDV